MKFKCDVTPLGVQCEEPAKYFLTFPEGSKHYQGQDPSPRCERHAEQARQAFADSHGTYNLVPIESKEGKVLAKEVEE